MKIQQDPALAAAKSFCRRMSTVYTRRILDVLDTNPGALKDFSPPDATLYSDPSIFAVDWCSYNMVRKYPGLPGYKKQQRDERAFVAWTSNEDYCRKTNVRLRSLMAGDNTLLSSLIGDSEGSPALVKVICLAQEKIEKILGPFDLKNVQKECKWSGGATFDLRRGSTVHQKMSDPISVTRLAEPILLELMQEDIHWMSSLLNVDVSGPCCPLVSPFTKVKGGRYVSVEKNAFISRPINAEPTGNAFLQQGVGRFIRRRLKKVLVDLDDQSFNQWMASIAHLLGYSTLDLESASDSVSIALIELLLPPDWYNYLFAIRSPCIKVDGKWITLEKFSAMGNAYTFELESLIFFAIASSVTELMGFGDAANAVYGDDIIVPRACAHSTINALLFFGFKINHSKSFIEGNFFESCGKHYFKGLDVTPANQTSIISGLPDVIRLHNRLKRWFSRVKELGVSQTSFRLLLSDISKIFRYPNDYGGLPVIPSWDVSDDGFLVGRRVLERLPYDLNMGYLCPVLTLRQDLRLADQSEQRSLLAYKLRRPTYSNATRKGYAAFVDTTSRWVRNSRYFPRRIAT